MFRINSTLFKYFFVVLGTGLVATAHANATETPSSCRDAALITFNETLRSPGAGPGEDHCYRLDFYSGGFLMLHVSTPEIEGARPLVNFFAADDNGAFDELRRLPASRVSRVRRPGAYFVHVSAEDPRRALAPYKLRIGFATGIRSKDEEDGEIEVDPDPMAACSSPAARLKDEEDGEIEVDPDPICMSLAAILEGKLKRLCATGEVDDHGDALRCATTLGANRAMEGSLDNPWGDDEDFFTFRVDALSSVEIETAGPTDTHGALYDAAGHLLGRADEGGEGDNFRLVRTLVPGVYFVRVAGSLSASGPYTLEIDALAR